MKNNKAFTLKNGGKASFFNCHRHLLPPNHKYKKNKNDFFIDRVEKDVAPPPVFLVKNCLMLYQSTVTLCLVSNQVSRSFLVLV
jgi:hypothetical protein